MTIRVPRLLAVSDAGERRGRPLEDWLRRLVAAGVDGVQVREKALADRELYELLRAARRAWPGWLIVNGRLDVALAAGADGVHLPADGVPVAALRRRFGDRVVIGRSTHRPEEVTEAREAGADYVTFGPVFPTPAKARYGRPPGLEGLARAAARGLPVIALGGIGPGELAGVAAAGAAGAAGIRSFHEPRSLELWAETRRSVWPDE
jgi:thiamine-phosphate pyrophosphorylase